MQERPDLDLRPELAERVEQRHELAELRYDLIEALQHSPEGLTDVEVAARTGRDVQVIRETMGDLANALIIEILPFPADREALPGQPAPEQSYRLLAI